MVKRQDREMIMDIDGIDSIVAKLRSATTIIAVSQKKIRDKPRLVILLIKPSEGRFFARVLREIRHNVRPEDTGLDEERRDDLLLLNEPY